MRSTSTKGPVSSFTSCRKTLLWIRPHEVLQQSRVVRLEADLRIQGDLFGNLVRHVGTPTDGEREHHVVKANISPNSSVHSSCENQFYTWHGTPDQRGNALSSFSPLLTALGQNGTRKLEGLVLVGLALLEDAEVLQDG